MRDRHDDFGDAAIAAVTFAAPEYLGAHRAHLELPFPVLADPDRHVYRRFDIGRGTTRQVWNAGTLRIYARRLRPGRLARGPRQDVRQLGGDMVVAPDGTFAEGFWPPSPDARPTVDELVAAIDRARRSTV